MPCRAVLCGAVHVAPARLVVPSWRPGPGTGGSNVGTRPHTRRVDGEIPAALGRLAGSQHGVLARAQARSSGMPQSTIRSKLESKRWVRIHRGVYATFTGPVSRYARLWAAILYAGPGAVLSHETAAEIDGLIDTRSADIHLTVPGPRRVQKVAGIQIHRSRRLGGLRFPPGEIPRTWTEDTVFDIAETKDDLDDVCALVTAAFGRKKVSASRMRLVLAKRTRQRWRPELEELITAAASGIHSVLEFRYDRDVDRAHGLAPSRCQVPFVKDDGTKGYRDREYDDFGVIIELDGNQAHPDDKQWADKERDNAAAADSRQSLRYGWRHVRWDPCGTALQVATVLRRRGWQGRPKPCSRTCPLASAASPGERARSTGPRASGHSR